MNSGKEAQDRGSGGKRRPKPQWDATSRPLEGQLLLRVGGEAGTPESMGAHTGAAAAATVAAPQRAERRTAT